MASLKPSRAGSLPIEVKTAAPTHAAVMRAGTCEGRLGRPCEPALFVGKDGTCRDDLIDRERTGGKSLRLRRRADGNLIIRRCMSILHGRIRKRGRDDGIGSEPLLTTCEIAAIRAGGQGMTATMMRSSGE
jgi:hypothetical protein